MTPIMAEWKLETVGPIGAQRDGDWYEKLYLMLLDSIPCSILLVDGGLRVITANRYFLEKSQRQTRDTVGRQLWEVFPAVILEHVDILSQIRAALESGVPLYAQRITYRAPGIPVRFYYYNVLPVNDRHRDRPGYVMLVMEDVTEQIRLSGHLQSIERQLANVVEHATDIILSTDSATRITTWNRAAEMLSGYMFEQVEGHPLSEYLGEETRLEFERAVATMKRCGQPQMINSELITSQGAHLPMSWVCSPMRNDQGAIQGIVAVGRDMTGAKHFEAQLHQSQRLAALGVMASGIAHELRNPLTLCSSGAQFLLEDDVSQEFRKECAQQIKSGIERASLVIENLLRFARPHTEDAEAELEPVEIGAVVNAALEFVDNLARLQRVQVMTERLTGPLCVLGNETLLQHVFINLFLNAIDAMPEGGSLTVSATRESGQVSISVSDTGCGIPADEVTRIFDPFYTRSRYKKGTGLGLSICYAIVKQHRGAIDVSSIEGRGSDFVVTLPLSA
jgi:PAS domain S-box-containing protein